MSTVVFEKLKWEKTKAIITKNEWIQIRTLNALYLWYELKRIS